ncbi:hypothetical protein KEM56_001250 [Ascosphaera pollenicola]|nr:hypothetical protein KEM56_001250 [Ascosphaera pollenicola]
MRDGDGARRGGTLRTSSSMDKRSSTGSTRSNGDDAVPRKASGAIHPPPHGRTSATKPHIPSPAWKVAEEHFTKELTLHKTRNLNAKTVVVMQDACYDHRFSRPNSTKAGLESIVERPERLQACALGVSAAYVLLGERSSAGRHTPQEGLDVSKLPTPPFQIRRSARSVTLDAPAVTHVHGAKWMDELTSMCHAAESRLATDGKELERPANSDASEQRPLHTGDLYLCPKSIGALQGALGGVCDGVDAVFADTTTRRAFVAVRPPGHHCSRDYPSGFCWLNNVHVGITHAAMNHDLTHAAIIDFDLHHGDGSQSLAWKQNARAVRAAKNAASQDKTRIGYFSLHDIDSFPCEEGDFDKVRDASVCIENAHGQFVHNVHMASWKSDAEFWELYEDKYATLLEKARTFLRHHTTTLLESNHSQPPKAAIFVSAGFDASEYESPGMQRHSVNVPTGFYARFTSDIVKLSEEEGLGVDGRIISVLEGGYSDRALTSGVLSHLSGLTATEDRPMKEEEDEVEEDSKVEELSAQIKELAITEEREPFTYHSEWWSTLCLEQLEVAVHGPSKKAPILKRQKTPPTYSSPTQASVAKAVVPPKDVTKRMATWLIVGDISPQEVDWCTAAKELRKLLIPSDREVRSYEFKELKAQAHVEKSRDMHTPTEAHGMSLRGRKTKAPSPDPSSRSASRMSSSKVRAPSRAGITTVRKASLPEERNVAANAQPTTSDPKPQTRPVYGSRRPSVASSTHSDELREQRLRAKSQSQPSLSRASYVEGLVESRRHAIARGMLESDKVLAAEVLRIMTQNREKTDKALRATRNIAHLMSTVLTSQRINVSDLMIQSFLGDLLDSNELDDLLATIKKQSSEETMSFLLSLPPDLKEHDTYISLTTDLKLLINHKKGESVLRSEYDDRNQVHTTSVVGRRVQLNKGIAKLSTLDLQYTRLIDRLSSALRDYFVKNLVQEELFLHEAFICDLKMPLKRVLAPRPRFTIERALSSPFDYLIPQSGMSKRAAISSQPAISIAYQLYLESGGTINVYDWWSTFYTLIGGKDGELCEERMAMALFYEALSELKLLGMIKSTKKKVDHVAKIAWMGI